MRILASLAALSLLLAACSDDDGGAVATDDTAVDDTATDDTEVEEDATTEEAEGFDVQLTGTAEVPGPGDEEGTGSADVILGDGEVCVEVEVTLGAPPMAMHIHDGGVDEAGPVVVDFGRPTSENGWSVCSEAEQSVIDEIAADPAGWYLNVHNEEFPDGAVRAQLS